MNLKNLQIKYHQDLSELYTPTEISDLFAIFTEKILNWNKITLYLNQEKNISKIQEKEFLSTLSSLKTGKPYQYILGESIFFGHTFLVNENVLIPRPETEELIELIISNLSQKKHLPLKILDIGTGSGCIPILLSKILPKSHITSIDISEKALEIAKKNAEIHQVNIQFILKDYLHENLDNTYDVIVSNPPYIDLSEEPDIHFSVKNFEPKIALFAPKNRALAFYEKITKDCQKHLNKNGWLFLEINQNLGLETLDLFNNFTKRQLIKDLSGNDRFIIGYK
jgi:hypothetical protein